MSIDIKKVPLSSVTNPWPGQAVRPPLITPAAQVPSRRAENPVLVDQHLTIIAGANRFLDAEDRGAREILVAIIPGLSPRQMEQLRGTDAAMGRDKRWSRSRLRRRLKSIGYDVPDSPPIDRNSPEWNKSFDTRFKPGETGNSNGRPKLVATDKNLAQILNEVQCVQLNGKTALMTNRELIERSVLDSALKGNPAALHKSINRMDQLYPLEHQALADRFNQTVIEVNFVHPDGTRHEDSERLEKEAKSGWLK